MDGLAKKRVNDQAKNLKINPNHNQRNIIANVAEIQTKQNYVKQKHRSSKAVTSGSDLSETQNEQTLNGQHRNSSSG